MFHPVRLVPALEGPPCAPGWPRPAHGPRRILIVGGGHAGRSLARELEEHFPADYQVVGFVEDYPARTGDDQVIGSREQVADLIGEYQIDEVMIADFLSGRLGGGSGSSIAEMQEASEAGDETGCEETELLPLPPAVCSPVLRGAKRAFDVSFSLAALILGAPLAALAALGIRLTSPGPVLYRQERVGQDGRIFILYKLRTMIEGAENDTGPILASRGDPRATPFGQFLRATKLDEWPQFFNVLKGDMSVVGPRPERQSFVNTYGRHISRYRWRHSVRPGITGLAQIKGGYLTHVYVKLHYDLMYVYNQSLWLDLWIVAHTPASILRNLKRSH